MHSSDEAIAGRPPLSAVPARACEPQLRAALLGAPCTVHDDAQPAQRLQGSLLEVRRLWVPPHAGPQEGPLYAFVRVKDADHRLSGWVALDRVTVKVARALLLSLPPSCCAAAAAAAQSGGEDALDTVEGDVAVTASDIVSAPLLSGVYAEVTPGMARTQRAEKLLDYLEERLLRDGKTPTAVRYFVYAGRYVFQPWYFAPYGLLHREFDPLVPVEVAERAHGSDPPIAPMAAPPAPKTSWQCNPFIRDAYLCPFSLRVYSTFEQLRWETAQYRRERLRPPGYEIYRDESRGFSLFEVNGSHSVTYCRHLFLLGKSFLENKLAGHDVQSYFFYVVCLHERHLPGYIAHDAAAAREPAMFFAGYFTWEKQVASCNLACIVTLPCFTGGSTASADPPPLRHLGQFMIAVSYELAYRRRQVGSPERPLSDLGAAAYERYWRRVLVRWLHQQRQQLASPRPPRRDRQDGGERTKKRPRHAGSTSRTAVTVTDASASSSRSSSVASDAGDGGSGVGPDDGIGSLAGEDGTARSPAARTLTVQDIARQVRLEEQDVLRTLLGMGLLHRNTEAGSVPLMVPAAYTEWAYARLVEDERSPQHCSFDPALLVAAKSSSAGGGRRRT